MIRPFAIALFLPLALSACGDAATSTTTGPTDAEVMAPDGPGAGFPQDAALRLSANASAPSAVYFTIASIGEPMTITGVTSDDAERIEMHESRRENGMMTMATVDRIEVPANGEVALRPGGLHLMVFGISDEARAAGSLDFTVRFANGVGVNGTATTANLAALEGGASGADAHSEDHSGH
jgi:hypothetical protein